MDQYISQIIDDLEITVPIIWIKLNNYLVGTTIFPLEIKKDQVMIKVGTVWENFEEYVSKKHRSIQRQLVIMMIKSGESLEWVIDQLMNGKKIKGPGDENYGLAANQSTLSRRGINTSPGRSPRLGDVRKTGSRVSTTKITSKTLSKSGMQSRISK